MRAHAYYGIAARDSFRLVSLALFVSPSLVSASQEIMGEHYHIHEIDVTADDAVGTSILHRDRRIHILLSKEKIKILHDVEEVYDQLSSALCSGAVPLRCADLCVVFDQAYIHILVRGGERGADLAGMGLGTLCVSSKCGDTFVDTLAGLVSVCVAILRLMVHKCVESARAPPGGGGLNAPRRGKFDCRDESRSSED